MGVKGINRRKLVHTSKDAKPTHKLKTGFPEKGKERARQVYRKSKGAEFELEGNIVLRALEFVDAEAQPLPVFNQMTNKPEVLPVLRLMYAAKLLNVSYQTLWRWTSETQQVPMPVLVDQSSGREYAVYHVPEVRAMIRVIGEHLTSFKYYRSDHEATKRKLFSEIETLRALNFNTIGVPNGSEKKRSRPRRKSKGRGTRRNK